MCAFFMNLFGSKDNCLFLTLSTSQDWPWSIKLNISKTILPLKKRTHVFLKVNHKKIYIQSYKAKDAHVFKLELLKVKFYFLNIFPGQTLRNSTCYAFWYSYEMKIWLFYIRLTYSIFYRCLKFQVNQENIHPI